MGFRFSARGGMKLEFDVEHLLTHGPGEYEGGTLSGRRTCSSKRPLTLGELTDFFLGAWDLFKVLEMNFAEYGYPPEKVRAFVEASSKFYPDFGKLIEQRVEKWLQQPRSKQVLQQRLAAAARRIGSRLAMVDVPKSAVNIDVPKSTVNEIIKNLEALRQAIEVENSTKALEVLTAVSLQMQHLYGLKKKIMGRWSAIFRKLSDPIRTKQFYDAWNPVTELLVRFRQAQESYRGTKVVQLPETAG
jgi:hypothetical protein